MATFMPTPYQRLIEFQELSEPQDLHSTAAPAAGENDDSSVLAELAHALIRNWKPVAAMTAIGLTCGLAAALLQKSVYRAKAVVEIQTPNEDSGSRRQVDSKSDGGPLQSESYLRTQLRLFESDSVLWSAAVKSGLSASPEYSGLSYGGKLEAIHANLAVKLAGQTSVIEIAFESKDPAAAANFANELVQSYRELVQGRRLAAAQQTAAALETQIAEHKEKTNAAQERLNGYVKTHGWSSIERSSAAEVRLRDLHAALAQAESARAADQSAMQHAYRSTAEAAAPQSGDRASSLRLMDLKARRAEVLSASKPSQYRLKLLDAEIAEADAAYQRERNPLLRSLGIRFDAAKRKVDALRADVARQRALVAAQASYNLQYQALKLDFDQNRAAYDEALRKYDAVNSSAGVIADNVQLLDAAGRPEAPVRPRKALIASLGAFLGLFAGLIAAFGNESRTHKIEARARSSASLGAPQLGVAPPAWVDAPNREPRSLTPAQSRGRYALWNFHNPASMHAEAYRGIVTSLMFASDRSHDGHLRVVVTSANAGEGRTTAAVSLALGIAETGCRVLIIDANRGKQALHEIFDAPDTSGFFQALTARDGLTAPVFASDIPNLFVMPAGPYKDAMIDVGSLRKVLEDLKQTYDVILIDAPPVLGHADARWLARVCDGCVMVQDPRITSFRDAQTALNRLRMDRVHVFGTLLNQWSGKVALPVRNFHFASEPKPRLRIAG